MDRVCGLVASKLEMDPATIFERGRGDVRSTARKIAAYLAHRCLEIPVCAVARHFGICQSSVSAMLSEGRRMAEKLGITVDD